MKPIRHNRTARALRGSGVGLALLLLLVLVAPTACLLWFMNQAVKNERLAVRQRFLDLYRNHASLTQDRIELAWRQANQELDAQLEEMTPREFFARQVAQNRADSIICLDQHQNVLYPDSGQTRDSNAGPDWARARELESTNAIAAATAYEALAVGESDPQLIARALQGQARALVQAGRTNEASKVLTHLIEDGRLVHARDGQGRLIVLNAMLLALEVQPELARSADSNIRAALHKRLLDYKDPIPAGQRRFLMRQLSALYPAEPPFPTLEAEDLAAHYLEGQGNPSDSTHLSESGLPGIWQWPSTSGRVISLHRTEQLARRIEATATAGLPSELRIDALAPGKEAEGILFTVPAGQSLPGWRLAFTLIDSRTLETAASQRVASYGWIAAIVVVSVAVLGLLALGLVRRQVALTRLRNDLVANVTHELKTPLSSMRLLVDTLIQAPALNETTAREYLELIARENLRLSRLIDNFLTFSRIERNKYAFVFKEVPAGQIAQDTVAAVQERFSAPGCRLNVESANDLPTIVADGDAVVTALVNLLDNAWKYSGEQKLVTLQTAAENGHVRFAVRDNGIGLSRRETRRIFKRFYQVNQKGSHSGGGCGLGLSIVDFIVTAHGGTVTVQSEPGLGSTFVVSLPLNPKRLNEG